MITAFPTESNSDNGAMSPPAHGNGSSHRHFEFDPNSKESATFSWCVFEKLRNDCLIATFFKAHYFIFCYWKKCYHRCLLSRLLKLLSKTSLFVFAQSWRNDKSTLKLIIGRSCLWAGMGIATTEIVIMSNVSTSSYWNKIYEYIVRLGYECFNQVNLKLVDRRAFLIQKNLLLDHNETV